MKLINKIFFKLLFVLWAVIEAVHIIFTRRLSSIGSFLILKQINKLYYLWYEGSIEYNSEDKIYHGKILNISDTITYEGATPTLLLVDFHKAVEEYYNHIKHERI